jgi:hypothetical protein
MDLDCLCISIEKEQKWQTSFDVSVRESHCILKWQTKDILAIFVPAPADKSSYSTKGFQSLHKCSFYPVNV